jgi:hypothetical protein
MGAQTLRHCHLVQTFSHFAAECLSRRDNALTAFVIRVFYSVIHVTNTPSLHIPNNTHTKHLQVQFVINISLVWWVKSIVVNIDVDLW